MKMNLLQISQNPMRMTILVSLFLFLMDKESMGTSKPKDYVRQG